MVGVKLSNLGLEVRHRLEEEALPGLVEVQRTLLTAASAHLASGGVLAYSTCALTREENRGVVEDVIAAGAPLEIEEERERAAAAFRKAVDLDPDDRQSLRYLEILTD